MSEITMYEKLRQYIHIGKYDFAKKVCDSIFMDDIEKVIMDMAYDTEGISTYAFALYMFHNTLNSKKEWLKIAINIMINILYNINGSYSVAAFLAKKLLKMERSLENLEFILFLHHISEKVVSEEDAKSIADEVLKINPNSEIALEISKKLKK